MINLAFLGGKRHIDGVDIEPKASPKSECVLLPEVTSIRSSITKIKERLGILLRLFGC